MAAGTGDVIHSVALAVSRCVALLPLANIVVGGWRRGVVGLATGGGVIGVTAGGGVVVIAAYVGVVGMEARVAARPLLLARLSGLVNS